MDNDAPKDGMVFAVSEMTNRDGYGSWLRFFRSRAEAQLFYREIEGIADRHEGLYPRMGVREVSLEKAAAMKAAERAWLDALQEEASSSSQDEDEDDNWDDDESEEDDDIDMYFDGDDVDEDEDGEGENDSFALLCDEEDEDEE